MSHSFGIDAQDDDDDQELIDDHLHHQNPTRQLPGRTHDKNADV